LDLFSLIALILIVGVVVFLINAAPFIDARFKQIATWLLLAVVIIYVILTVFGPLPNVHIGRGRLN